MNRAGSTRIPFALRGFAANVESGQLGKGFREIGPAHVMENPGGATESLISYWQELHSVMQRTACRGEAKKVKNVI